MNVLSATLCFVNARNTLAAGEREYYCFAHKHSQSSVSVCVLAYLDRVSDFEKKLDFFVDKAGRNAFCFDRYRGHVIQLVSRIRDYPTPSIASSFSLERTHTHTDMSGRARTLAQRSADIFEWGSAVLLHQHQQLEVKE